MSIILENSLADELRKIYADYENKNRDDQLGSAVEVVSQEDDKEKDSQYQGIIRFVKGAYLVYKREQPDGTYQEMWIYNTNPLQLQQAQQVKQAILAGTDINTKTLMAPDDPNQRATIKRIGNAEILVISGLPQ